jgi:hypothetical protein
MQADQLLARAADQTAHAERIDGEAVGLRMKIDALPPLAAPIDTAEVKAEIDGARRHNALARKRDERALKLRAAEEHEAEAKRLTDQIAARTAAKRKEIEAAKLPVEGLGFGDGNVLLNGVPFEQASDAEQLRASVAIAMAGNPKLRVIRVRDGSLLDADGMKLLAELADRHDMQVWIERVASDGKVGFVIEDGHARPATEAAA